jgi:26S proteasome regulatory subunit N9
MAVDPEVIQEFLSDQRENAPEELLQTFLNIEDNWERKLWHELTNVLIEYFQNPESGSQKLPLFTRFIVTFSEKINQLKFVSLGLSAATQCSSETCLPPMCSGRSERSKLTYDA